MGAAPKGPKRQGQAPAEPRRIAKLKNALPPQKQWLMVRIKILTGLQKEAWLAWIREGDEALAPVPYRPGVSLTSPAARGSSRGALSWLPASVCVLATLGLLACHLCGR